MKHISVVLVIKHQVSGEKTPDSTFSNLINFRFFLEARDMSETLFYAEQRVIPNTACVGFFANDLQLITSKVICSLSVDMKQSACLGDAGAPLVTNEYGTSTLIGLLSFMHESGNCGQQPVPAVFTRITTHFDWIAQTTNYQFRP